MDITMALHSQASLGFDRLYKTFNQGTDSIAVLSDMSILFEQNKKYALTGISGAGKSTIIHLLAGLDSPTKGSVYFNNNALSSFTQEKKQQFLNESVGLIFQSPYLLKELSVLENVMIKSLISAGGQTDTTKAKDLLSLVGLADKSNAQVMDLSGGEQQRIAIARAIYSEPAFLLADEPTAHLDEKNRDIVLQALLNCQKQWSMGLIVASHDPKVWQVMDYAYEIVDKKLCRFTISRSA